MVLIIQILSQGPSTKKMGQILKIKSIKWRKKNRILVVWLKKTDFKTKVTEIECKIPIITGLATNSELSAVENKIPNITSLVKKTDFNIKTTEIEGKIPGVSSLVKKTDFDTKLKTVSDRVTKNKAKHLLVENKLKKLQKLDSAYFSR